MSARFYSLALICCLIFWDQLAPPWTSESPFSTFLTGLLRFCWFLVYLRDDDPFSEWRLDLDSRLSARFWAAALTLTCFWAASRWNYALICLRGGFAFLNFKANDALFSFFGCRWVLSWWNWSFSYSWVVLRWVWAWSGIDWRFYFAWPSCWTWYGAVWWVFWNVPGQIRTILLRNIGAVLFSIMICSAYWFEYELGC